MASMAQSAHTRLFHFSQFSVSFMYNVLKRCSTYAISVGGGVTLWLIKNANETLSF